MVPIALSFCRGFDRAMSKRVKMQPMDFDPSTRPRGTPLWPIVIAGAVAGVMWSGFDLQTTRASATELTRLMPLLIHPWAYHACF